MILRLSLIYLYVSTSISLQLYASAAHISEDDSKLRQWNAYKIQFNKMYESLEEDQSRMKIYFENVDKIVKHNERFKKGEVSFEVGMNQFGDWFRQELIPRRRRRSLPSVLIEDNSTYYFDDIPSSQFLAGSVPKTKNWVVEGAVTSVKDQGKCGSCWAFSTVGLLESHVFLHNERKTTVKDLSPQNLVDCVGEINGVVDSCHGGWVDHALDYAKINGIATDESYPYLGKKHACKHLKVHTGAKIKSYVSNYNSDAGQLQTVIGLIGPVSVYLDSSDFGFWFYKRGIYYSETCSKFDSDHALVIVGYGSDENGKDYWLLKNSRGVTWGENGFARVARNFNVCGIEQYYFYPEF